MPHVFYMWHFLFIILIRCCFLVILEKLVDLWIYLYTYYKDMSR
jgi:hypothetical protein